MKLTLAKSNKITKRLLLISGLFLLLAGGLTGFAVSPAEAAPSSISFNDLVKKTDPGGQEFCAPIKKDKHAASDSYTRCLSEYTNGVTFAYYKYAPPKNAVVYNSIQQCFSGANGRANFTTNWAPTTVSVCGAYAQGASIALGIIKSSPGSSQNNNSQQNNNQPAQAQTPQPPLIGKCDKAKTASDQKKCRLAYRQCDPPYSPSYIATCKTNAINKYTNNPSPTQHNQNQQNQNQQAANNNQGDPAISCSNGNCDLIAKYVNPAINLFSLAFGLLAVISLILGGIQYAASEGDPQKAAKAKSRLYNTVIAIFAYLFMYAFLQFLIPGGAFR